MYSSLEPEIQKLLRENETQTTSLVPVNNRTVTFISESIYDSGTKLRFVKWYEKRKFTKRIYGD